MLFYFVFIFAVISLISGIMLNKEELSLHSRVLIITVSIILIVADASVAVYLGTTDLDKSNYYNKYYKEKERIKAENIKIVEEKKNSKSDDTSLSSSTFNCIITFTDEYSIERSIKAKRSNISTKCLIHSPAFLLPFLKNLKYPGTSGCFQRHLR